MFHSIVVPIDLGADGEHAVPVAADLAGRASSPVDLRYVKRTGGTTVFADRDDALVVLGTRARNPLGRLLLGGATEALLARTDEPLLLVGPHVEVPLGPNLVVAVADANAGAAVLPAALEWARRFAFDLWFVEVAPKVAHWWESTDGQGEEGAAAALAATARALGVAARWDVLPAGDPATVISDFTTSMGGGVIAVTSRRWVDDDARTHWASTARALVHRAPFPVLVQPVHERVLSTA
jgi:nucleotide-binding universal stress UspA family protein